MTIIIYTKRPGILLSTDKMINGKIKKHNYKTI